MDNTNNREPEGSPERPAASVATDTVTVLHARGRLVAAKRVTINKVTGEYVTKQYDDLKTFRITEETGSGIMWLAALLEHISEDSQATVVRGKPREGIDRQCARRLLHPRTDPKTGEVTPATLEEVPRRWLLLDIEKVAFPPGIDPLHEPDGIVEHVVSLLPPEFEGVTCRWAFTAGHFINGEVRIRLAYWLDRPLCTKALEAWFAGYEKVDASVFRPAQVVYTAHPVFERCHDPVPHRSGIWRGYADEVAVPEIDLSKPRATYAAPVGGHGLGYQGYRALIGDHEGGKGFNRPLLSAAGAYFRRHGAGADDGPLLADLEQVIRERGTGRGDAYVERRIRDLAGVVRHARAREAAREREEAARRPFGQEGDTGKPDAFKRCDPDFKIPSATIDEASDQLRDALRGVFLDYLPGHAAARWRYLVDAAVADANGADAPAPPTPRQIGIGADMSAGKTEAAIDLALEVIDRHPEIRIAYSIPNHVTGADFIRRINRKAGREIARRWIGTDRADPEAPGHTMCRRLKEMKEALAAGGDAKTLCGDDDRGYCPFHPKGSGPEKCGTQRQAAAAGDEHIRVWVIPHAMLDKPLPAALRRPKVKVTVQDAKLKVARDPFDLLVIDEMPWLGMFGGVEQAPYTLRLDVLMRDLVGEWAIMKPARKGEEPEVDRYATDRLAFLSATAHSILADAEPGWFVPGHPKPGRAELTADMCMEARRLVFRLKIDPEGYVDPADMEHGTEKLRKIAKHNAEVLRMARFWKLMALACPLPAGAKCPYVRLRDRDDGRRDIVMAWREDIHDAFAALPTVYLDGTMNEVISGFWLPRLEVVADIKAKTPGAVYRRQIIDRAIGHGMVCPDPKASEKNRNTQHNNVGRFARLLEVRAHEYQGQGKAPVGKGREPSPDDPVYDGAVICPLAMMEAMKAGNMVPERFGIANQNNVRGSDAYRGVRYGAVISAPRPQPFVPELFAWLCIGRVEEELTGFYPKREVGILMRDGSGRKVEQFFHPHPVAEAFRWQITEGEVLQDEARFRAKRRDDDSPLLVEIMCNVPLHLEIDEVVEADALLDEAHPLAVMVARAAVFEDYAGAGRALADMFRAGADPANAMKQYFKRHPERAEEFRAFLVGQNGYRRYRYCPDDRRRAGRVLVHVEVADPRAHVEALVGPCKVWEEVPIVAHEVAEAAVQTVQIPAEELPAPTVCEPEPDALAAVTNPEAAPGDIAELDPPDVDARLEARFESFKRAIDQASAAPTRTASCERLAAWFATWLPDPDPDAENDAEEDDLEFWIVPEVSRGMPRHCVKIE